MATLVYPLGAEDTKNIPKVLELAVFRDRVVPYATTLTEMLGNTHKT